MPEMVPLKESTMLVDWGVLSVAGFNFKSGGVESGLVALEKINVEREKLEYESVDRDLKLNLDKEKLDLDKEKLDLDRDRLKVEESKNQHNIWHEVVIPVSIKALELTALLGIGIVCEMYNKNEISGRGFNKMVESVQHKLIK